MVTLLLTVYSQAKETIAIGGEIAGEICFLFSPEGLTSWARLYVPCADCLF